MVWEIIWPYIYYIFQKAFAFFQRIYWKKYAIQEKNFEQSAHVCQIICRYKKLYNAGKFNFMYVHKSFCHPKTILKDNISLYCLEKDEAIFVDCGGVDIFSSKHSCFMYNTQFERAINIIIMPISSAKRICKDISVPNIPMLNAANHGRCGSTLLFRFFESIPNALAISEPKSLSNISEFSRLKLVNDNDLHDMCDVALKMLMKHAVARKSKIFFVKGESMTNFITDIIYNVMPQIKHIYIYRDPIPFVRSYEKLFFVNNLPIPNFQTFKLWAGIGHQNIHSNCALLYEDCFYNKLSLFARISIVWILGTCAYNQLIKKGSPIKALKYEDLISSTNECMEKLLGYMEVKFDKQLDFQHILERDSQDGSKFTSRNFDKEFFDKVLTKLNDPLKAEVDRLCYDFDVPLFWKGVRLPKTM